MKNDKWPKICIVILNWNGWKDTIECLESLYRISYSDYDVVVVDNNSQDDSLARIRAYARNEMVVESPFFSYGHGHNKPLTITEYTRAEIQGLQELSLSAKLNGKCLDGAPDRRLVVIKNERNFGFSEGSNIGIRYALKAAANYVLLLNNDTVVEEHFLAELVRVAQQDRHIGVIGPAVFWYNLPDRIQSTGANINFWTGRTIVLNWCKTAANLDISSNDGLLPVNYVAGACFLVKREVIDAVGELDPMYFLYGEEADWCLRISRAGYSIICDLNAKIWHKRMRSSFKSRKFSQYYPGRNRVVFMRKYAQTLQFLSFLLFHLPLNLAWLLKAGRFRDTLCYIKGFIDGLLMHLDSSS
ncbi:MAG: glycosyltransferase family 2 protein [Halobacteriota archaeon]|jgi:GT2 family glycosyltransferase